MFILPILFACNSGEKAAGIDNGYRKGKETLSDIEGKHPARFIQVIIDHNKNLVGQTVIKGQLLNSAKIVSFRDVEVEFSFFGHSGSLLERDREVIDNKITPGQSCAFKYKYYPPKGTDSVSAIVITAAVSQ